MNAAVELFVSYSHRDESLQRELMTFLKPLERDGVVRCWYDARIEAGEDVDKEIARNLDTAEIILLLVSADFVASDYCYSVEMKRAVARHAAGEARVIPVILRHVDWRGTPFATLKAVPKDGRPVVGWASTDEAFLDVTREIRRAINSIGEHRTRLPEVFAEQCSAIGSIPEREAPKFEGDWFVESCDSEDGNPAPERKSR
jgi:hypothetical protein